MPTNRIALMVIAMAGLFAPLSPTHSQIMYGQPTSGDMGFIYSHWSLDNGSGTTEISQLTIPLTGFVPIRDNLEAFFYVANSSNTLEGSNTDYSLSGLSDARLQLNRSFNDDHLLLSVGVNLPTGKKKLNRDEELLVLQMLSQNYLNFPMRRFGEGFGVNMLLGGAQMLGEFRCGAGIMYQYNGSYNPYEEMGKYDPGDFVSINAGADWQNDRLKLTGNVIFTGYTDDKLEGSKVLQQSSQFDLRFGVIHSGNAYDISGGIGYLLRGRNTFYNPDKSERRLFGDVLLINASLTRRLQQGWRLTPSLELKHIVGADEDNIGSATIFGLGGAVGRTFGEQIGVTIGGKYFTGNADDGDIDLSGFQLTASLTGNL